MDLLTLAKKIRFGNHSDAPTPVGTASKDASAERLSQYVKRTTAKGPTKNQWGGKDDPIDVSDYQEFAAALTGMAWILRDMGYDVHYMTSNGLSYDMSQIYLHPPMFNRSTGKIVALIASTTSKHFRITRGDGKLRVRSFPDYGRAIAPVRDNETAGTQPFNASTTKELVRVLKRQTRLNPGDADSIVKWGRIMKNGLYKPKGVVLAKNLLKNEFSKVK